MTRRAAAILLLAGILLGHAAARADELRLSAAASRALEGRAAQAWAVELDTGLLLADSPVSETALPGSLVKVFLYLHAAQTNPSSLSAVAFCGPSSPKTPSLDACWDRRGHGNVSFRRALACSCQRFASMLAARVDPSAYRDWLAQLGMDLAPFPPSEASAALTGHDASIHSSPRRLLAALSACVNGGYVFDVDGKKPRLMRRLLFSRSATEALRGGLELGASEGTAKAAGLGRVLAKTGTAPRVNAVGKLDPLRTQGWAFVAAPAKKPRIGLLVHLEHGTGAEAARVAGKILKAAGCER